jgi:hypothetical protein
MHRSARTVHAGDALGVEENILLIDVAGEIGFGQD